ncbi:hypothetical protein [Paenibacillus contaminans]|uniref:Uncharacterized protein n=1 Tax=Paenibacillus contaminans TaxID=450362 RepID=A0A329MRN8_9BACL|nr:hypothetical protein [Paenibacillus contaminans]RAV22222.1 hypothetical protein DQG23_04525 [Paenibacillus contaminans]
MKKSLQWTYYNQVTELLDKVQKLLEQYHNFYFSAWDEAHQYNKRILQSFITANIRNGKTFDGDLRAKYEEQFDLDAIEKIPVYGLYNPFVSIRIYHRKIKALNRKNWDYHKQLRELMKAIKKLDKEMEPYGYEEMIAGFIFHLHEARDRIKRSMDYEINIMALADLIRFYFVENNWMMDKHSFLQIITVSKDKRRWDGTRTVPYAEIIKDIPDLIDYNTFERLIFMENLEDDKDDYLHDIFMDQVMDVMKKHREQTGVSAFEVFQEALGKPLQTFTLETDAYGDVVNVTPNKPSIKLVR